MLWTRQVSHSHTTRTTSSLRLRSFQRRRNNVIIIIIFATLIKMTVDKRIISYSYPYEQTRLASSTTLQTTYRRLDTLHPPRCSDQFQNRITGKRSHLLPHSQLLLPRSHTHQSHHLAPQDRILKYYQPSNSSKHDGTIENHHTNRSNETKQRKTQR